MYWDGPSLANLKLPIPIIIGGNQNKFKSTQKPNLFD